MVEKRTTTRLSGETKGRVTRTGVKIFTVPGWWNSGANSFPRIRAWSESLLAWSAARSACSDFALAFAILQQNKKHWSTLWCFERFVETRHGYREARTCSGTVVQKKKNNKKQNKYLAGKNRPILEGPRDHRRLGVKIAVDHESWKFNCGFEWLKRRPQLDCQENFETLDGPILNNLSRKAGSNSSSVCIWENYSVNVRQQKHETRIKHEWS